MRDRWQKIGVVAVDSGCLIVTDFPKQSEVKNVYEKVTGMAPLPRWLQLHFDNGGPGAGVIFSTGIGDGTYDVKARIGKVLLDDVDMGERVKEIRIRFVPHPVIRGKRELKAIVRRLEKEVRSSE